MGTRKMGMGKVSPCFLVGVLVVAAASLGPPQNTAYSAQDAAGGNTALVVFDKSVRLVGLCEAYQGKCKRECDAVKSEVLWLLWLMDWAPQPDAELSSGTLKWPRRFIKSSFNSLRGCLVDEGDEKWMGRLIPSIYALDKLLHAPSDQQ